MTYIFLILCYDINFKKLRHFISGNFYIEAIVFIYAMCTIHSFRLMTILKIQSADIIITT